MLAAEVPTSVKLGEPQKLAALVARELAVLGGSFSTNFALARPGAGQIID